MIDLVVATAQALEDSEPPFPVVADVFFFCALNRIVYVEFRYSMGKWVAQRAGQASDGTR